MLLEDMSRCVRTRNWFGRLVREVIEQDFNIRVVRFGRVENGMMLSNEPMILNDKFRLVRYSVGSVENGCDRLFDARERISIDGKSFSMVVI